MEPFHRDGCGGNLLSVDCPYEGWKPVSAGMLFHLMPVWIVPMRDGNSIRSRCFLVIRLGVDCPYEGWKHVKAAALWGIRQVWIVPMRDGNPHGSGKRGVREKCGLSL